MQDHDDIITNSQLQDPTTNQEAESQGTDTTVGNDTIKDPDEWNAGDEPMTNAQNSYLKTLSDEAGEEFSENLTQGEASKRIELLQQKTGRGKG
ncbi:MAG: DUF3072 domain-containing protein [Ginsengibacter sp.]